MGWVARGDVGLKTILEFGSEIGLQWREFPVGPVTVYADMRSFDCVAASLRGAVTSLRMTAWWRRAEIEQPR